MQIHKIKLLENIIMNDNFIRYSVNINKVEQCTFDILRKIEFKICNIFIVGSIINRTIILHVDSNIFIIISLNCPISELKINVGFWFLKNNEIEKVSNYVSIITLTEDEISLLKCPRIKLVVLYHEKNFPFPRFALGVADIASSLRDFAIGKVDICDMQIGKTLHDVEAEIRTEKPDIIGFSITFGQNDLLEQLLDSIYSINDYKPLVVIGGSLAYLNREHLLRKDYNIIICNSYGEKTMREIVSYWLSKENMPQTQGISFWGNDNNIIETPLLATKKDWNVYGLPELDILPEILNKKGVSTLETSRGCMNACSFCPRKSKGLWKNIEYSNLEKIMPYISKIYDQYEDIPRKLFLVDEEFFGNMDENITEERLKNISELFYHYRFMFESSARINQIYTSIRDESWHVRRANLLLYLKRMGLCKCLFGVESGVDEILKRFNKNTTSKENTLAVRMLSTLGLEYRTTYITYDPLMSMNELKESYIYQGRTDIILKENCESTENIYKNIEDKKYITEFSTNSPFYTKIPYMLVTMECLFDSKYTENVIKRGMVESFNTSMGKYNTKFIDNRIGLMSLYSQLWIDKNFALDYFLKSMMKVKSDNISGCIEKFRFLYKQASYIMLGMFLSFAERDISLLPQYTKPNDIRFIQFLISAENNFEVAIKKIIQNRLDDLRVMMGKQVHIIINCLDEVERCKFNKIYRDWLKNELKLINQ